MTLSTLILTAFFACNNSEETAGKSLTPEQQEERKQVQNDYKEIMALKNAGDNEEALKKIEAFQEKHPKLATRIQSLKNEIEVVGKPAPKVEVKSFFTGESDGAEIDTTSDTVFVVFWEKWCPHCRSELPKLEKIWQENESKGLKMLALTQMTKGTTEEEVKKLLADNSVTYPSGHLTDRGISEAFAVKGIPAAAMVKDGKIVWRGHPGGMTSEKISKFLSN